MDKSRYWLPVAVLSAIMLSGCVSKVTKVDQYSGYLDRYDVLQSSISATGAPTLRWISPDFNPAAFDTVDFDGLELFPAPTATDRVNMQTFVQLQQAANKAIVTALSKRYRVSNTLLPLPPNAHPLVMKAAITGVSASNEGMKWYEVIPVAAVVGGVGAITGHRDQNTELYIEAALLDPASNEPVARVVRKVFGKKLENSSTQITTEDFTQAINGLGTDLSAFIR
ncbi:DUF3313 domain-containing protein [Pseudomonas sp. Hz4]